MGRESGEKRTETCLFSEGPQAVPVRPSGRGPLERVKRWEVDISGYGQREDV
jgi:hypothetical protein